MAYGRSPRLLAYPFVLRIHLRYRCIVLFARCQMFDVPVEIRYIRLVLKLAKLFEFLLCLQSGFQRTDFASISEYRVIGQIQETVQERGPIAHRHRKASFGAILRQVEIRRNNAVEFFDVLLA